MTKKHEKKQWLLKKLAESTAALTIGATFILAPGQAQATTAPQVEKKQPVMDRLTDIKNHLLQEHDTTGDKRDHEQKARLLAQYGWPNWPNWNNWPNYWNKWPNWNKYFRNW